MAALSATMSGLADFCLSLAPASLPDGGRPLADWSTTSNGFARAVFVAAPAKNAASVLLGAVGTGEGAMSSALLGEAGRIGFECDASSAGGIVGAADATPAFAAARLPAAAATSGTEAAAMGEKMLSIAATPHMLIFRVDTILEERGRLWFRS